MRRARRRRARRNPGARSWALGLGFAALAYVAYRFAIGKAMAQHDEATAAPPPGGAPTGPTTPDGLPAWAQAAEEAMGGCCCHGGAS